jgi:hypothetical protein
VSGELSYRHQRVESGGVRRGGDTPGFGPVNLDLPSVAVIAQPPLTLTPKTASLNAF